MAKLKLQDQATLPEILPCKCGDIAITVRPRGGRRGNPWNVVCLNPNCDRAVRGFDNPWEAIRAWNEEVKKSMKIKTIKARPRDPVKALQTVRDFCNARKCSWDCPLYNFCGRYLSLYESPADWKLPGEEGKA